MGLGSLTWIKVANPEGGRCSGCRVQAPLAATSAQSARPNASTRCQSVYSTTVPGRVGPRVMRMIKRMMRRSRTHIARTVEPSGKHVDPARTLPCPSQKGADVGIRLGPILAQPFADPPRPFVGRRTQQKCALGHRPTADDRLRRPEIEFRLDHARRAGPPDFSGDVVGAAA